MISLLSSALLVPLLFACEAPQSAPTPTQRTVDEPSMIDALPERAVQRFGTRRLLHPGLIYAAVFGGGGEWFATGAEDGWVRVFDGKTGDLLRAMDARGNGGVVHLAISRDGTRIAAGTRGSILKIFRVATGESVGELEEAGMASAWLDEGRFASIDGTKRVFLVDAESGAQLAEFDTSPHGMEDIVLSPCGRWIAARGRNREKLLARAGARGDTSAVFVFDAGSFEHVGTIGFADASTTDMVFSPDGERLYIADDLGRVDVYAPSEREEVDLLAGDGLPILSMALDPVGRQLLLARSGGAVERVRLEPFERIDSWLSRAAEYGRLVCRPSDGAVLATSGQHLELRSASDGSPIVAPRRHLSVVKALDFSADGSRLLSGSHDGTAILWDVASGAPISEDLRHGSWLFDAALSPDGRRAVTASRDGGVYFWWLGERARARRALTGEFGVLSVDLAPTGGRVLAASAEGTVMLLETPDVATADGGEDGVGAVDVLTRVDRVGGVMPLARFLGGPDRCVVAGGDLRIFSLPTFEEVRSLGDVGSVYSLTTSDDGRLVAVGLIDGNVRVIEAATGRRRAPMVGHGARVHSLAFDPDGRYVAAVHEHDDVVRVWSVADGREVARWSGQGTPLTAVRFSPDGRNIATGGFDGSILLWRFEP